MVQNITVLSVLSCLVCMFRIYQRERKGFGVLYCRIIHSRMSRTSCGAFIVMEMICEAESGMDILVRYLYCPERMWRI